MDWNLLKNTKRIITHSNCPDGMGSAIILRVVFPEIEPEFYHHSQDEYLNLKAEEGMLFCDIIPPEHRAQEFVDVNSIVLDHHKGVEHIVDMFGELGIFADEKKEPGVSGTTLAWREVFVPWSQELTDFSKEDYFGQHAESYNHELCSCEAIREFAILAGIRDTWQINDPKFKLASEQAAMLTFFPWEYWKNKVKHFSFEGEMLVGHNILNKRLRDAAVCVDNSVVFDVNGYKVAVFNDPDKLCSDTSALHIENGVDVVAGFYYFSDLDGLHITYSLRSNDNFSVGKMAKSLGGGGHTKASGFSLKTELEEVNPFLKFKEIFEEYSKNVRV